MSADENIEAADQSADSETTVNSYEDDLRDFTNSNETLRDLDLTAGNGIIDVDLYPVVTCFAVLLTLVSVGLVGNAVLLAVTSSKLGDKLVRHQQRKRPRHQRDTVVINLCVVQLLVCVVVSPLEFATVAENYVKRAVSPAVCRLTVTVYHLLVATLVSCLVLHAWTRRRHLQRSTDDLKQLAGGHRLQHNTTAAAAITTTTTTTRCCYRRQTTPDNTEQLMLLKVAVTWFVGLLAAAVVSLELPALIDYKVCYQSAAAYRSLVGSSQDNNGSSSPTSAASPNFEWRVMLSVLYVTSLAAAAVYLFVCYVQRHRQLLSRGEHRFSQLLPLTRCPDDRTSLLDSSERRDVTSEGREAGGAGGGAKRKASNASTSVNNRSLLGRFNSKQSETSTSRRQSSTQDKENDMEEDDDTFDMKMRLKFQKKSRSSGRRHTVANIGLPDLTSRLRRGSLSDTGLTAGAGTGRPSSTGSGSGSAATTPEYHYVRKWSVDITALANQLENPKAAVAGRAGSYQFGELAGALRASPTGPARMGRSSPIAARPTLPRIVAEVEQETTREEEEHTDSEATDGKVKDGEQKVVNEMQNGQNTTSKECPQNVQQDVGTDNKSQSVQCGAQSQDGATVDRLTATTTMTMSGSKSQPKLDDTTAVKRRLEAAGHSLLEHVSSLPLDPPSIVVSSLNDEERRSTVNSDDAEDDEDDDDDDDVSADRRSAGVWTVDEKQASTPGRHQSTGPSGTAVEAAQCVDERLISRVRREVERTRRTCVVLAVCVCLTLPFMVVTVWNCLSPTAAGHQLTYNLSLSAAALLTLQAAVNPALLVWADHRLVARLLRLWTNVSRLRCVCYCNVGRGKSCLNTNRARI